MRGNIKKSSSSFRYRMRNVHIFTKGKLYCCRSRKERSFIENDWRSIGRKAKQTTPPKQTNKQTTTKQEEPAKKEEFNFDRSIKMIVKASLKTNLKLRLLVYCYDVFKEIRSLQQLFAASKSTPTQTHFRQSKLYVCIYIYIYIYIYIGEYMCSHKHYSLGLEIFKCRCSTSSWQRSCRSCCMDTLLGR